MKRAQSLSFILLAMMVLASSCNPPDDKRISEVEFPTFVKHFTTHDWADCGAPNSCGHFRYEIVSQGKTKGITGRLLKVRYDVQSGSAAYDQCVYAYYTSELGTTGYLNDILVSLPASECRTDFLFPRNQNGDYASANARSSDRFDDAVKAIGYSGRLPASE